MALQLRRLVLASFAGLSVLALLAGCSFDHPGYPSYQGELGNVNSIEMAWADGSGMGAFVDATDPPRQAATPAGGPGLRYRVRVVFDSGFTTTVIQDGSVPLAVGERVWIQKGKVVPHEGAESAAQADPDHRIAPF